MDSDGLIVVVALFGLVFFIFQLAVMIRLYGVLTNIRIVCNAFMAESDIGRQTAIRMFDEGIAPGKIALKLGVRLYITTNRAY